MFHSLVAGWFDETFAAPTAVQRAGLAHRGRARHADRGTDRVGQDAAAFMVALDDRPARPGRRAGGPHPRRLRLAAQGARQRRAGRTCKVPLAGIAARAEAAGTPLPDIRVAVRSGDTPARERALQARRPPHVLITTPESLYILLTAAGSRCCARPRR
ncbi:MAG: hypothetical protein U0802_15730 [Candidatus Binatia bacterium]